MKISDKPMMSEQEIEIIDKLLGEIQPKTCLEWGSGASTIYFSDRECIDNWLSIEHNGHYVEYLKDMISLNTTLIWLEHESYYNSVKLLHNHFDFILIDGEDREKCLEIAKLIIKPEGVILLHDADGKDWGYLVRKFHGELLSRGEIKVGTTYAHRGLARFKK